MVKKSGKNTIIHVIDSLTTGGAEEIIIGVVQSLQSFKHVVVTLWEANDYQETTIKYPFYCLKYKGKLDTIRVARLLKKIILNHNANIVHSHLLAATSIARLAINKSDKLFFSVHSELSKGAFKISKLSRFIELLTYKKKHVAIFVSNIVKDDYQRSIGLKGSHFILYNFVEDKYFGTHKNTTPTRSNNSLRFLAIGKLKEQKNHVLLIQAFARLDPMKYSLDIWGDGPLEQVLREEISNLNAKNVALRGKSKNPDTLFKNYHYFILASKTEGYGLAPLEAMASKIPCILSNIPSFQELVPNCAVYFDPNSVVDLLKVIKNLDLNSKETREMLSRAQSRVNRIGSKKDYVKKLEFIYNM
jgi:glycosyltransferase involved in cell wall biosynthesis